VLSDPLRLSIAECLLRHRPKFEKPHTKDFLLSNIMLRDARGLHLEGTLPVREFCAFHYLREFDVDNSNFTGAS